MKEAYPVLLTKTKDTKNTILVEVPDLNIQTEGYGIADAIEMAREQSVWKLLQEKMKELTLKNPRLLRRLIKTKESFLVKGKPV